nr:hypothetical protein [Paenibacillus sp. F411]
MEKYIGAVVEIIYIDRKNNITQRQIEVLGVRNGRVRAQCLKTRSPRVFLSENILATTRVGGGRDAARSGA